MNRHDDSTPDRLRRMAASDEMLVGRGRSEQLAQRAMARAAARPARRTLAVAVTASAFAVVSVAGLGAAAEQALPGEPLYTIDRAYESVSDIVRGPVDRSEERMLEALKLLDRGNRELAITHLAKELSVQNIIAVEPVEMVPPVEPPEGATGLAAVETTSTVPSTSPTTAVPDVSDSTAAAATSEPVDSEAVEEKEDPLRLALEYALQAKQAAKGSDDEAVTAEAEFAVRSVLQLAIAPSDTETEVVEEDSGTVAASQTSTTTTTVSDEPRRGNGVPGNGNTTTTTTTTSVPGEDLSQDGSGDGESSTGDDLGDSQEGAGGSTEPGDGGSDTGPLILPIP